MSNDSISVLAVDDNEDALFALERMLSHNGYQVYSAKSGVEALELLRSEDIDILLLDVMMPEMDGYEVTRQMKADERLRYIPVILVTAKSNLEDIVYGLDQGADDYITKPFKQDELIARLNAVVRMKSLYQELRDTRADNRALRIVVQRATSFDNIIGNSRAMQRVFDVMEKVVNRDGPVLILGESGTGKEVVAQA